MRQSHASKAGAAEACGVVELLAVDVWATVLLVAAVAKCRHCDPQAATITRLFEQVLPGVACETLVCVEIVLGLAILFGGRRAALWLTVVTGAVSAAGNGALWMLQGNVDCGCLGAYRATHALMACAAAALVLLALLGRPYGIAAARLQGAAAFVGVALALAVGLAGGDGRPSSILSLPSVAGATADGDILLFGSSTCSACATITQSGRLDVAGRLVDLDAVTLVYRNRDPLTPSSSGRYRAVLHVPDAMWWNAVGAAAPAAYIVAGDELRRVPMKVGAVGGEGAGHAARPGRELVK
jgi:hypothetical protein